MSGCLRACRTTARVLQEMNGVLAPGGRTLIGVETNAEDWGNHSQESERLGIYHPNKQRVRALTADGGFAEVSIAYEEAKGFPSMMPACGWKR